MPAVSARTPQPRTASSTFANPATRPGQLCWLPAMRQCFYDPARAQDSNLGERCRHQLAAPRTELPLTAYRLPLTAHRLPLTAYRSPLTAHAFQGSFQSLLLRSTSGATLLGSISILIGFAA